ncbi:SCP2 sterol-binding domain-containing protein [Devosia sp. XJ19-1]|uniref:SCP2 sterol-binding domain-containing protein n=1 Tax=Devosia ureilytica TaxID=2952754 RepID=A0A9Q4AQP6_9HYPH|nr:SCP2 sterol-binding domain-containing protein [Devosia ureilytica]MCP8884487.1 SCP2 sterol-binding domain-containing protein [Devosia ureilytica]MCP8888095.1 SCP2 sterol-binding domain-containing protein [Devosia ureilytica]
MLLPRPLALAIDHLPLALVQAVVEKVFQRALQQHPDLFDRLGPQAEKHFRFTPADLDLSFLIHPASRTIRTFRKANTPKAEAAVSGPLLTLLALLEGRIDGDAVFFSRSLTATGDMEAMLALRNALDDCGFDLPADLAGMAGPLARPFQQVAELVRRRALAGLV